MLLIVCRSKKETFIMLLYQEYTKWGEVWVSVFSLSISVQQKSWCHTRISAKLLKGNWHLIVTEDVSNKWWSPKVYVIILEHIWWMMVALVILEYIIHCNFALDCRTVLFRNVWCLNNISLPDLTDIWVI